MRPVRFLPVISGVQEKMGIMNKGVLYALWDYEPQNGDELPLRDGDCMTVIRREDEEETEWWWARLHDKEGYVPRNLLGVSEPCGRVAVQAGCAAVGCAWALVVCGAQVCGGCTVSEALCS